MSDVRADYPHDWTVMSLEQIASRITSGGTPTSGSPRYYVEHGGLPFAKTEDLTRARSKFIEDCELGISVVALKETAAKRYPTGTILISMYGTIGLTKVAAMEMAANQALCALIPPLTCSPDYLYHHLDYVRPEWLKHSGQTTQANINGATVRAHEVPLPGVNEQRKIAQIIDTLDTAIHETEAIIAKLKVVKQGLLHDLLTRGIDANGELRPPQVEASHLYKGSPLGWIPKEWDASDLGSVTTWASGGTPNRAIASNWIGDVPLLTPKDMKVFELNDTSEHISLRAAQSGSHLMPPGTVFIVVRGMILAHSFPVVLATRTMAFNQDIKAVSPGPQMNGRFLAHWFVANSDGFLRKVTEATHGTKKLDMEDLLGMAIGLPPVAEQDRIVARQTAIAYQIEDEALSLSKLQTLKSGLMDDLLTGRVRVTPLLAEVAQQKGSA